MSTRRAGPSASPLAADLWRNPSHFNLSLDDRTKTYEVVRRCLSIAGVNGRALLFRRVKRDSQEPDWQNENECCICYEQELNPHSACFLACTDRKKFYCGGCVENLREGKDQDGRIRCPICRLHSYFVNVQWVLGDQEKRESAADARKKRAHRRRKKLQRVKANETKRKQKDHVAVINISGDENYQQETVINDSNRRNRGVEGGKEVIELTDDEDREIEVMEISDDEEVENR